MTKILGLTGGIASGKSTVSKMFREINIPIIDTDLISREVVRKGTKGYYEILEEFGQDILLTDQEINRKLLGRLIFMNKVKREKLNSIIHPKVIEECISKINYYKEENAKYVVLDVPLLYETGFDQYTDFDIVIYVTRNKQIERLMDRDMIDKEYAIMKIDSQLSMEDKIIRADFVINNNQSILDTKHQFNELMKELEVE